MYASHLQLLKLFYFISFLQHRYQIRWMETYLVASNVCRMSYHALLG